MQTSTTAKRIYICQIHQESNSFNPTISAYNRFAPSFMEGEDLIRSGARAGLTVDSMVRTVMEAGCTIVGGVRISSGSGGPMDAAVACNFVERNLAALRAAMPVDGVLVALHGATQSTASDDVCGDILEGIRQTVGDDVVIAASCDLHANVTARMMRSADFICGYQTYPHVDHDAVGRRAAQLLLDKLSGHTLKTARVEIPMMAPAHAYSTGRGKLKALMERAHGLVQKGTIVDFSIFQVQPWLDVEKTGSVVLVTAETEDVAKEIAADLAAEEFALREELQGEKLFSVEEVIKKALENTNERPVILVDNADSPNAGACGDSAAVLERLLPYRETLSAAVAVIDAAAVEKAFAMGVGSHGDFYLGASIAPLLSKPVLVKDAVVRSLHDGRFVMQGPAQRGQRRTLGKTAVLQAGELLIQVTTTQLSNGDLQFYRGFGIEPSLCRLVSVKACTSFRAGYEPISAMICNAATPGAAGPVLTALPYQKVPVPFYPFQEITEDMISEPVCYR